MTETPSTLLPNLVVGITGKAGAGKDTVAAMLRSCLHGLDLACETYRLADQLKRAYEALFCLPKNFLEDFENKNKTNQFTGTTHRQELQFLGTEAYRTRTGNQDVWVQLLAHKVRKNEDPGAVILVPDVRFPNEADFVLKNGLLVEVVRKNSPLETFSNHSSEAGIAPHVADVVLDNSGDLRDLESLVEALARRVKEEDRRLDSFLTTAKRDHLLLSRLSGQTEKAP